MSAPEPSRLVSAVADRERPAVHRVVFLLTFLGAWVALDRLVTSPPTIVSAAIALVVAAAVVTVGERTLGSRWHEVPGALGLGRPHLPAVVAAAIVGGGYFLSLLGGAWALGVTLELRDNWPLVLVAALLFHGLAEELVWRGFVFGHLRRSATFRRALWRSIPLIALTHVAIVATNGLAVGVLALITAAATCLPFAFLWERGGRTVWAPALLHGLIGSWQLFERDYPVRFQLVLLLTTIAVPMAVFLFRRRLDPSAAPSPGAWRPAPPLDARSTRRIP